MSINPNVISVADSQQGRNICISMHETKDMFQKMKSMLHETKDMFQKMKGMLHETKEMFQK